MEDRKFKHPFPRPSPHRHRTVTAPSHHGPTGPDGQRAEEHQHVRQGLVRCADKMLVKAVHQCTGQLLHGQRGHEARAARTPQRGAGEL